LGAASPEDYYLLGDSHWVLFEVLGDATGGHLSASRTAFERYVELSECKAEECVQRHMTALLRLSEAYSLAGVDRCGLAVDYAWRWVGYKLDHLDPQTAENCWNTVPLWLKVELGCPEIDPFEQRIRALERCALLDSADATGHARVASLYWDKALRDPELTTAERLRLANRGFTWVERALELDPELADGLIYKAYLLQVRADNLKDAAAAERSRAEAARLLEQASDFLRPEQPREGATELE
jgi:hypothetical protein